MTKKDKRLQKERYDVTTLSLVNTTEIYEEIESTINVKRCERGLKSSSFYCIGGHLNNT